MPWTPPESPDPFEIHHSASEDARNGAFEDALAKQLWYHHNALRLAPSHTGVRLSFALGDWVKLGEVYPPARAALVRTRDDTEAAFAADPENFDLFHDLSSLNRELGDRPRTANIFTAVARRDPETAGRLYHVAEPSLIAAGCYAECGPFLDPVNRVAIAREAYTSMKVWEDEEPDGEFQPPKHARTFFVRDAATLVALLVLNSRGGEVAKVRTEALAVVDDDEFRAMLDAAASGHLPPPIG
jgi:hypothetical protein